MGKYLWLDTETTGLEPEKNGLIEIAGLVEIDGYVEYGFNINSGIFEADEISEGAAAIQGLTVDDFAKKNQRLSYSIDGTPKTQGNT